MLNKRRTLTNFSSFVVSKGLALLFFFLGVRAFMLEGGATEYGVINLVLVLYTYLWIADMGIGYALNLQIGRLLATDDGPSVRRQVRSKIAVAVPAYLAIALGASALGLCWRTELSTVLFATPHYAELVAWTALATIPVMISALASAVLRAFDKVYLVNVTQLLLDGWRASCLVLLAADANPAVAVGMAFCIGAVARALLDLMLVGRLMGWSWLRPQFQWSELRPLLSSGAPTMGSLILFAAFFSLDRVFASHAFSLADVANYSLAADLHTKAYFLVWALNAALYQPLVARHSGNTNGLTLVNLNVLGALTITLLYYLPLAYFAPEILTAWINQETAAHAAPVVWAMLPGSIAYLLASSLENALLKTRGLVFESMLVHAAMLTSMLLALTLLPSLYGLAGIGWSYTVGNVVYACGVTCLCLLRSNK